MPKQTIQSQTVEALKAWGCQEVQGRSSKYRTFTHPNMEWKIFIGRKDSVRVGSCATKSHSMRGDRDLTLRYIAKHIFG